MILAVKLCPTKLQIPKPENAIRIATIPPVLFPRKSARAKDLNFNRRLKTADWTTMIEPMIRTIEWIGTISLRMGSSKIMARILAKPIEKTNKTELDASENQNTESRCSVSKVFLWMIASTIPVPTKISSKTRKAYAEQEGLTVSVFYGWSKRFKRARTIKANSVTAWVAHLSDAIQMRPAIDLFRSSDGFNTFSWKDISIIGCWVLDVLFGLVIA